MLGHRELTFQDYVSILRRRFWLILASAVFFLAVGLVVSYRLPPRYVSQTLILIEEQKVPEDYVKPVVNEDLGERLASMKEQILSRSRIQPIIERFDLFAGPQTTMDDRIEMTQKAIGIKPIQSARGMPGFFISFTASDARIAQQVCGEITTLFMNANLSAREQSAEGTTDFLKQQLEVSKRALDDQDAKLAAFQTKYLGKLPEQEGSNSNALQALTTQLDSTNQAVNRAEQTETFLKAMISQQSEDVKRNDSSGGVSVDDRRAQLKALIAQRQELEVHYTPEYPDVVAVSHKIADLQAEIAKGPSEPTPASNTGASKRVDTPQLQDLKAQLRATQQTLELARQDQASIRRKIGSYESKIAAAPMVEEQYKEITRDHESALKFYNGLLSKMNESSMATALEHRQQGEQFHVMDAPNLPDAPTFPKRSIFAMGGMVGGLALGLVIAALLEYRDTSVRNERDIAAFTQLPTLVVIPHVMGLPKPDAEKKRWRLWPRATKPIESTNG